MTSAYGEAIFEGMGMDWYDILKAARRVGSRETKEGLEALPFTAAQLAEAAGFKSTAKSRSNDIAAGWISNFVRWGYILRGKRRDSRGGRPVMEYSLTTWGLRFERVAKKKSKTRKS